MIKNLFSKAVDSKEKRRILLALAAGYGIISLTVDLGMLTYFTVGWLLIGG